MNSELSKQNFEDWSCEVTSRAIMRHCREASVVDVGEGQLPG